MWLLLYVSYINNRIFSLPLWHHWFNQNSPNSRFFLKLASTCEHPRMFFHVWAYTTACGSACVCRPLWHYAKHQLCKTRPYSVWWTVYRYPCPLSSVFCVLWVSYLVSAAHKTGSSIHLTHTHLNPTIHLLLVGVQPVSKWEFDSGNALNNFSDLLVL